MSKNGSLIAPEILVVDDEEDIRDLISGILRDEGFITIVTVIDSSTGKIVTGPEIHARGIAEDDSVFDEVRPRIVEALEDALAEGVHDADQLQQVTRRVLGSFVGRKLRRRPMIIPLVLEA